MFNTFKNIGDSVVEGATSVKSNVVDGVCYVGDTFCEVGNTTMDYSSLAVNGVCAMSESAFNETKKGTFFVYDSVSDISEKTKNQIFDFLKTNKDAVVSKVETKFEEKIDDVFEDILLDTILSFIHGLIPFPFKYILPEIIFVAFGKKYIQEIKRILI